MSDADPLGLIRCDWGHKIGTEQDHRPCSKADWIEYERQHPEDAPVRHPRRG